MKQNLTCFKCYNNTATLTYEENRIYKVSCPCGCEYEFEHSSMKCAEEYHYKMLELYGEIDRAKHLQQENEQLKKLLQLAMEDMKNIADTIANSHELLADGEDEIRSLCLGRCDVCNENCHNNDDSDNGCYFVWQHADKLKGVIEI